MQKKSSSRTALFMPYYIYSKFIDEIILVIPLLIYFWSSIYGYSVFYRQDKVTVIVKCFSLAFLAQFVGLATTFLSGIFMWQLVFTMDISYQPVYEGWLRSWYSYLFSLPFTLFFIVLAVIARNSPKVGSIKDGGMNMAHKLAIPAGFILFGTVVSIFDEIRMQDEFIRSTLPLFSSFVLLTYYLSPLFGLPYAYFGLKSLKEFLSSNKPMFFIMIILWLAFIALVLFMLFLWIYALYLGNNPLDFWKIMMFN
ncbi:MAG: hypothetical protein LAT67_13330 [Balneolales bacterium]|nr:hypothetical protein [Balneolales bacterium]